MWDIQSELQVIFYTTPYEIIYNCVSNLGTELGLWLMTLGNITPFVGSNMSTTAVKQICKPPIYWQVLRKTY
jgi:hypothetical protein